MRRKDFVEAMKTADSVRDDEFKATLHRSFKKHGKHVLVIAVEELSELTKETTKWLRGLGNRDNTLQELADATIAMGYIMDITHISSDELDRAIKVKLDRVNERLNNKGRYS